MIGLGKCPGCGIGLKIDVGIELYPLYWEIEDMKMTIENARSFKKRVFNEITNLILKKENIVVKELIDFLKLRFNLNYDSSYEIIDELKLKCGLYEENGVLYC